MDKLQHILYPVCNESYPSIVLINGKKYRQCHCENFNRFFTDNNINLEKVSEEFQDLTEIKEMLIVKAFTVMSVYRLRDRQYVELVKVLIGSNRSYKI